MSKPRWLSLFNRFVRHLRITSKHATAAAGEDGVPLDLWMSQRKFLEEVADGLDNGIHFFVVLKSRQLGVTTVSLAIDIFWAALHPNSIGALVFDNDANSEAARATLTKYVHSMRDFMGKSFSITKSNRVYMSFSNGSRIDFLVAGKSKKTWGESRAYAWAHLSEVSKYGQASGLASFLEGLSDENPNRLYIFESTAFGLNHWKDFWDASLNDPYTRRCIFLGWWSSDVNRIKITDRRYPVFGGQAPDPEENDLIKAVKDNYGVEITMEQLAWYRWRKSNASSGEGDLDQNQPWTAEQAFVQSGISFFQTRVVGELIRQIAEAPAAMVEDGGFGYWAYRFFCGQEFSHTRMEQVTKAEERNSVTLRVWEEPVATGIYVIGCDPAYGRNEWGDRNAVQVYRCFADRLIQVAEFADADVETRQFTWILAYLAGCYANCMVNIDMQGGPGRLLMAEFNRLRDSMRQDVTVDRIRKSGVLIDESGRSMGFNPDDFLSMASWYIFMKPDSMKGGGAYNTVTTTELKFRMMNMMRDSVTSGEIVIRSRPMLEEMLTMTQDGPHIGASANGRNKDDRTFASALANMSWIEHVRPAMLARGETYEAVMAQERGERTAGNVMQAIVMNFIRDRLEDAESPPPPSFLEQRGLA